MFTLLHRAFKLYSDFELFHEQTNKLKTIFEYNGYSKSFLDFCIKKYLDQVFIKKEVVLKASKRELTCILPFIAKKSRQPRTCLVNSIKNLNLKFKVYLKFFYNHYANWIRLGKRSVLILFTDTCAVTARLLIMVKHIATFFTGAAEHMGISNLTGKRLKKVKQLAVSDHLLGCNCSISFDHLDVLASWRKEILTYYWLSMTSPS